MYAHLFEAQFLSGAYNSIFEEKYFSPICRSGALQVWLVAPSNLRNINNKIDTALEPIAQQAGGRVNR